MNSRKICIGHKDWKLSYAVYPVSQTCSLIPSILSCDCQGVENLTTKSREKYRTQLLPWGVLPSCFCSCINILIQAPVCGGVTASLCSRMEVPSWYVLSQGGQFRYQWGLTPAGEAPALGLKVLLLAAVVLSRSLWRLINDVIQTRQIRALRHKIVKSPPPSSLRSRQSREPIPSPWFPLPHLAG